MNLPKVKMLQVSKCLIGLAVMMLQSCDVSYNEATDVLTFSPNGDYVRVKPQPGHPTEE